MRLPQLVRVLVYPIPDLLEQLNLLAFLSHGVSLHAKLAFILQRLFEFALDLLARDELHVNLVDVALLRVF